MAEVFVAAMRWNFCDRRPSPPTKKDSPSTSSRLPTMLPVIEALTSATWPLPSATSAMISSAALPNVAFRKPPHAGPERQASCSVPSPIRPASGISATAALMNTHAEPGDVAASTHETGAATSRMLSGDAKSLIAKLLDVLVVCARQQVKECVEAAIERAAKLRDRAVEGVQREAGVRTVGEFQRAFFDAFERALRDETNAVHERVASHLKIVMAAGGLRLGLWARGWGHAVAVGALRAPIESSIPNPEPPAPGPESGYTASS